MKTFWIVIPTICLAAAVLSKSCLEVKLEHEKNCQRGDPRNYINCVRTRMKRQSCKYDDQCTDCDCHSCEYSQCNGQCNDCCNSCCADYVQCHTNHCCHKQCHSECRTYYCRSLCRKSCYDSISRDTKTSEREMEQRTIERVFDRTIVESGGTNNNVQSNTSNINAHNITTVINLKNVINNTNLIDVPINLNYTNKNNISLTETISAQGGPSGPSSSGLANDDCCIVIGPRQCVQIQVNPYVKCFYLRSRQCGSFCTGTIVHKESPTCTVNAYGQPVCQDEPAYIPQPQPRCAYSNTWPYVTCGGEQSASCEGCYRHYSNSQSKEYQSCSPQCYNDFGAGPLYRQGPVYQPTYSHLPPCYLTPQGCGEMGGFGMTGSYAGGFGGYMGGLDQRFDGGFGYAPQLPMLQPGLSFPQSQGIYFNPQLLGDGRNATSFINSSDKVDQRHTRHLNNNQKTGLISDMRMKHRPSSTRNSLPIDREQMDGIIINQYQPNRRNLSVPLYELPDQEVKIDVTITDPNKTPQSQQQHRKIKESNEKKGATVVRV